LARGAVFGLDLDPLDCAVPLWNVQHMDADPAPCKFMFARGWCFGCMGLIGHGLVSFSLMLIPGKAGTKKSQGQAG
jgi:hypothetical protein